MRQYFYLIAVSFDEYTSPKKIFLQESDAITFGRRLAGTYRELGDNLSEVVLYKQVIARTAQLTYVRTLRPYSNSAAVK